MESFENSGAMLRGSFERGSFVEGDARINSLLGSMIQPGSMVEQLAGMPTRRIGGGDENSIEDDGIPQVDVYIENVDNSGSGCFNDDEMMQSDVDGTTWSFAGKKNNVNCTKKTNFVF